MTGDGQWPLPTPNLSPGAFTILRDLVHDRTGLYYEEEKREILSHRLSGRLVELGLDSFLDYYYFLKYDSGAEEEWRHLMDALSVPETYFWREVDQIKAMVDVIVPRYAAGARGAPLRIWSAGCASGEEPLTIAMALQEAGWFDRLPIQIEGSDASDAAIARAREGVYRERSFRSLAPALREKYFTPAEAGWRISPEVQARVQWSVANLLSETDVARLAAPVIFCRNVFIYFSERSIRQVLSWFCRYMPEPACLFTSASESLLRVSTRFELQDVGGSFMYARTPRPALMGPNC